MFANTHLIPIGYTRTRLYVHTFKGTSGSTISIASYDDCASLSCTRYVDTLWYT